MTAWFFDNHDSLFINAVFKSFASFKYRVFRRRNFNFSAGLRVTAGTSFTSFYFKSAKANDLYFFFLGKSFLDAGKYRIQGFFRILFGHGCLLGHTGHQFSLVHKSIPLVFF